MKRTSKRVWSGLVAVAIAASIVPLLSAPTANAAGVPQPGGATIRTPGGAADLSSGTSASTFTVRLPSGAACGGDSANDGYRVQSYIVPASVDPSTLTFDLSGPIPNTVGAGYRQPLYDTTGTPYVNAQTAAAATPPGPGPIVNIPDFDYKVFAPGNIPAGAYNVGIACTLGPAGATQMKEFWNVTKTFSANAGDGFANVNWSVGAVPSAPTLASVTAGDAALTANFTPVASTPATTGFTVIATPASGPALTATGAGSPITISGLTNGTAYSVTVRATNSVGDSVQSNAISGTPVLAARPPVQNLTATPGTGSVSLNWDAPTGPAPTGYGVIVAPSAGTVVVDTPNTSATVTGLTAGTAYTFTVTPLHTSPFVGTATSTAPVTPFSAQLIQQEISVTRPVGALVLTQRCGVYGALDAEAASTGFAAGFPAAAAIGTTGTAPYTNWNDATETGSAQDSNFGEYPYPVDETNGDLPNPTYPTHCGVNLGIGKLVTSGAGAGQFFAASGRLNQVTVVDTRDSDPLGWTINGTIEDFTVAGGGASFNGNHLGWTPKVTDDSDAFDSDLNGSLDYDQVAIVGGAVAPRTVPGLKSGRTLGSAVEGSDLGIAVLDARLKLLIPVTARNGRYTATLSFTTV